MSSFIKIIYIYKFNKWISLNVGFYSYGDNLSNHKTLFNEKRSNLICEKFLCDKVKAICSWSSCYIMIMIWIVCNDNDLNNDLKSLGQEKFCLEIESAFIKLWLRVIRHDDALLSFLYSKVHVIWVSFDEKIYFFCYISYWNNWINERLWIEVSAIKLKGIYSSNIKMANINQLK